MVNTALTSTSPTPETTPDLQARIIQIITKSKALPVDAVTPASTFDQLEIDSLDKINLTFDVEELFDVEIPDDSLTALRTVQDGIDGVQALLAAKAAAAS